MIGVFSFLYYGLGAILYTIALLLTFNLYKYENKKR